MIPERGCFTFITFGDLKLRQVVLDHRMYKYLTLVFFILCSTYLLGQGNKPKKIRYKAETLTVGKEKGEKFQKLLENVVFTQQETVVYCDSSYYFKKKNVMEAYSNVKIVDDSVTITSDRLTYDGELRSSELRRNVIYRKAEQRMYTDFLDYQLDEEIAHYFNNGKLEDETNTLTSVEGYFYAQEDRAMFYKNVVLVSPDFTLKTDTLRYNTLTKIAYTKGPTVLENQDGSKLFSEGGIFRTVIDQSDFVDGKVETEDYELEGDELFFDDLKRYYKSIGNTILTAKTKDVIITGDEGFYDKENGLSKVYGNPVMKRILEADTFYLAADTLVAIESEYDSVDRILAYHNIRVFKTGLQGRSDSASYFLADSLIYMYEDPVLWNGKNQVNADTISLYVTETTIEKMNLYKNSFLVGQDTLGNFNQIKGRNMDAFFKENLIDYITVDGNAEGIYFALSDGDSTVMGMNKFICSTMKIGFTDQQVTTISIYEEPDAQFIPPHELTREVMTLKGYSWRVEERPSLMDVLYSGEKETSEIETLEVERSDKKDSKEPPPSKKLPVSTKPALIMDQARENLLKDVKKEVPDND